MHWAPLSLFSVFYHHRLSVVFLGCNVAHKSEIWKYLAPNLTYLNNCSSLKAVDRVREVQTLSGYKFQLHNLAIKGFISSTKQTRYF